jgi:hypothetical protein
MILPQAARKCEAERAVSNITAGSNSVSGLLRAAFSVADEGRTRPRRARSPRCLKRIPGLSRQHFYTCRIEVRAVIRNVRHARNPQFFTQARVDDLRL